MADERDGLEGQAAKDGGLERGDALLEERAAQQNLVQALLLEHARLSVQRRHVSRDRVVRGGRAQQR